MRSWILVFLGILISGIIISTWMFYQQATENSPSPSITPSETSNEIPSPPSPSPSLSPSPSDSPSPSTEGIPTTTNPNPDLSVDSSGLSKATVIMTTTQGVIRFKFYPEDARNTVNRIVELINKGFYNGLTFHRVIPGFVIQGGDPVGNGTGGSGQKLSPEFNNRRHVEGTVAMARGADPNSADSQFYISLGTHPHLDHNYTVFGQVIEGMDAAKKIKEGDKMMSVIIQ